MVTSSYTLMSCLAGGGSCALWDFGFNQLDCLRVRWQVQSRGGMTLSSFAWQIIQQEGLLYGLWRPGLSSAAISGFIGGSVRLGLYPLLRDSLRQGSKKKARHMWTAGFLTGALGYWLSAPFFQARVRLQAQLERIDAQSLHKQYTGALDLFKRTIATAGFSGLFRGSSIVCVRGALVTAGHLLGYDLTKDIMKGNELISEGPMLHFIASASGALLATFFATPADYTLAGYMNYCNRSSSPVSVRRWIIDEAAQKGILRFYRGSSLLIMMLFPVMCFYNLTYEELRYQLGIGYLD